MKRKTKLKKLVFAFLLIAGFTQSQEKKVNSMESELTVFGTSNIHDWEIDAENISGNATFDMQNGEIKTIKSLNFTVVAESLKSGKTGMDKNTYKALKTASYKTITFKLTEVNKVVRNSDGSYTISTQGNLSICGVTKKLTQQFIVKLSNSKVMLSGEQKLDMTVYGIEPPTALMGTIKTGKVVTVDFNVVYN